MLKENIRICDVCDEEISKGETYRVEVIKPEVAAIFLNTSDKDLIPTWTQKPDGTVILDVCLDCHLSMGNPSNRKKK